MPECKCSQCVESCLQHPGWFAPKEAEKASKYLNMSFDKFISKYLIRDYWIGDENGDIFVWAPRKVGIESDRETASWGYAFERGRCVFLTDENLCQIHPVKPMECRETMSCKPQKEQLRLKIIKEWEADGNPLNR